MKKTGSQKKQQAGDPVQRRPVKKAGLVKSMPAPGSGIDFSVQRKVAEATKQVRKRVQQPVLKTHQPDMDALIRTLLAAHKSKTGVNTEWVVELFRVGFPYTKSKLLRTLKKEIPDEALRTELADTLFQRFGA